MRNRYLVYYLALLIAVVFAASCYWFWRMTIGRDYEVTERVLPRLHLYDDPAAGLARVKIRAYYVVPQNRKDQIEPGWFEQIEQALKESVIFFQAQFRDYSEISYEIYPNPVILAENNAVYDTEKTDHGNPHALQRIESELLSRGILEENGDEIFRGSAFIYEGVGASGKVGSMILSRTFLARAEYDKIKSSLFAHELGHVFGLPDRYDLSTDISFSDGLMGGGRKEPIERVHLEGDLLAGMGLISEK
ncbi:MAG: hypothetical protein V1856_00200 [Candidatus Liptonbacteria bacterium]